jgi:hypothetical protein
LPDFSRRNVPKWGKINQITTKFPNDHIMYPMAVIYYKWT